MLSVSDIKNNRPLLVWLGVTVFCMLFAFIYEMFSFGVYSMSMIFMFLYPLLLGAVPCLVFHRPMGRFWNDGVLLLMGAGLLAGILEIYGTSSTLTDLIWWMGVLFLLPGPVLSAVKKRKAVWNTAH